MAEVELPNPEELHERREDHFSRRVALVTAVFAVLLAIAALGGNHAMKEMLLAQQKSSDQWAFYQAKVIREHQYRGQKLRLEVDLLERGDSVKPEVRDKLDALMKRFAEEEKRYNDEKKDIQKKAEELEKAGQDANVHAEQSMHVHHRWAQSMTLIQVAIALAAIALLTRKKWLQWGVYLAGAGSVGLAALAIYHI